MIWPSIGLPALAGPISRCARNDACYTELFLGPRIGPPAKTHPSLPLRSAIPTPKLRRSLISLMPLIRTDAREDRLAGPIRGELLGAEHLAERGQMLASGQRLSLEHK